MPDTPKSDADIISEAYEDSLKSLFGVLSDAFGVAWNDPAEKQVAEQRFSRGLAASREARDRAIALVKPQP